MACRGNGTGDQYGSRVAIDVTRLQEITLLQTRKQWKYGPLRLLFMALFSSFSIR